MIFLVVQFTFLEFLISWLSSILFSKDINLYFYELNKVFERNEDWSFAWLLAQFKNKCFDKGCIWNVNNFLVKFTSSEKIENYKWNEALVALLNQTFLTHPKSKSMAVPAKKQHGRRWFSSVQHVIPGLDQLLTHA